MMTIEELKQKKAQLESDIQYLVIAFQQQTELNIKTIEVARLDASSKSGVAFITVINTTIDL